MEIFKIKVIFGQNDLPKCWGKWSHDDQFEEVLARRGLNFTSQKIRQVHQHKDYGELGRLVSVVVAALAADRNYH